MPSYLGQYKGAAKDRPRKLLRAVDSVLAQDYKDWELLIVADGCQNTVTLIQEHYSDKRIRLFLIPKQPLWSGIPRNVGKFHARGENIVYLDTDDMYTPGHLSTIAEHFRWNLLWVWFNDYRWNPAKGAWYENFCHIDKQGKHGTSNICFRRSLEVSWEVKGNYLHDYYFVRELRKVVMGDAIPTPGYKVCHLPGSIHSKGYDI